MGKKQNSLNRILCHLVAIDGVHVKVVVVQHVLLLLQPLLYCAAGDCTAHAAAAACAITFVFIAYAANTFRCISYGLYVGIRLKNF